MKTMKKTAAAGIALAATAGLVAGPVMMSGQAWASQSFTITQTNNNEAVTYKPIQIFTGTVTGNEMSDVHWAGEDTGAVATAVKGAVDAYAGKDGHPAVAGPDAADYAAYLAQNLLAGDSTSGYTTILGNNELGLEIAIALKDVNGTSASFKPGQPQTSLAEGYWVIIPSDVPDMVEGASDAAVASSPIFTTIAASDEATPITVNEKTKLPGLTKQIDNDGAWKSFADTAAGKAVQYKLTTQLPSNVKSFASDSFTFTFTDTLGDGLAFADDATFTVKLDDVEVTLADTDVNVSEDKKSVELTCGAALYAMFDAAKNNVVTVEYSAVRNNAVIGDTPAVNTAQLEYSNDPVAKTTGKTVEKQAKDYSYALNLEKYGDDYTNIDASYSAAKFTVQTSDNKYVSVDEETGAIVYTAEEDLPTVDGEKDYPEFEASNGAFTIDGLDADTYTITETKAPGNPGEYKPLAGSFKVTIAPATEADGVVTAGGAVSETTDADHVKVENDVVKVENLKYTVPGLPLTGADGITLLICAGTVLVLIAGGGILINRRKNNQED